MTKRYDRDYFQRWYHSASTRVNTRAEVRRKISVAVSLAEYFLQRPIRTVLDVGCGEGAWRQHLRTVRPKVEYTGLDTSDYVVQRFGRTRNIRKASFADLPVLDLGVYDLVVCSDVLHYLRDDEIRSGIGTLASVTDGIAYIEVLTREDEIIGDLDALIRRPAAWYRRVFEGAALTSVGPYCWLSPAFIGAVAEMESF
jgi:SAM-dependent methyltransferase